MPEPSVITPTGDLDVASVEAFRTTLGDAARETQDGLIVDLSDVDFIDSSGLGAVLEIHERLRREQRSVAVIAPRGTAAAVLLSLTGLRRRLAVFESRSAASRR